MNRLIGKVFLCAACLFGASSWAATITYTAADIADAGTGDLWRYTYTVNGSFTQFGGFEILFDPGSYTLLQDPAPTVNGDWSVFITQPDVSLGTSGVYAATALTGTPSLADVFTLDFVWLGAGTPSSQSFDVIDENFNILQVGRTTLPRDTTPVPEPASLALVAGGLLLLRRMRKSASPV